MTTDTLPNTLSGLLRAALDDLEKVEQMPDYTLNMTVWHQPYACGLKTMKCAVCLAGSMLVTRGADKAVKITPDHLHGEGDSMLEQKMYAVNCLRMGDVFNACKAFDRGGIPLDLSLEDRHALNREVTSYHQDKQAFKSELRALADDLEKAGV